jgi:NitT/TauT family transport system substrate-binding protein
MRQFRFAVAIIALALLVPALSAAPALAQAPVKVRVGMISALFDSGSLIALEKGYFKEVGIEPELITFTSSGDANQAMAIGQIDTLSSTPSVPLFTSRTRNIDLSIVAAVANHTPGHGIIGMVLRRDLVESGRYKTPADLKGMKFATGLTTPSHWFGVEVARTGGVAESSLQFVGLGIANTIAAMANKAIDGGSVQEPFVSLMAVRGDGVVVKRMDELYPNFPAGYLIYGPLLTKTNVDAGNRYMVAYIRGMEDYRAAFGPDKKDQPAILEILKKHNVVVIPQTVSLGIPADYKPSLEQIDKFLQWHVTTGTIRAMPDMKGLVDDRFRLAALAKLHIGKK